MSQNRNKPAGRRESVVDLMIEKFDHGQIKDDSRKKKKKRKQRSDGGIHQDNQHQRQSIVLQRTSLWESRADQKGLLSEQTIIETSKKKRKKKKRKEEGKEIDEHSSKKKEKKKKKGESHLRQSSKRNRNKEQKKALNKTKLNNDDTNETKILKRVKMGDMNRAGNAKKVRMLSEKPMNHHSGNDNNNKEDTVLYDKEDSDEGEDEDGHSTDLSVIMMGMHSDKEEHVLRSSQWMDDNDKHHSHQMMMIKNSKYDNDDEIEESAGPSTMELLESIHQITQEIHDQFAVITDHSLIVSKECNRQLQTINTLAIRQGPFIRKNSGLMDFDMNSLDLNVE